jgi:hypothetical protein
MKQLRLTPLGYWLEFRPGDVCLYTLEDFGRETAAASAEIRGLYTSPQPGCNQEPAAYRGRYWHQARNYMNNSTIDPDALPMYLGQVLHDPERDGTTWMIADMEDDQ